MASMKIKYTKTERARQKKILKVSERMLPLFEAMEKALMTSILSISERIEQIREVIEKNRKDSESWIAVFSDSWIDIEEYISVREVITVPASVAGIRVQHFERIEFNEKAPGNDTPIWVDDGIQLLKEQIQLIIEIKILEKQIDLLEDELLDVRARIKLFENRRIPNARTAIRKIGQKLQDDERLTIATAKVVKNR